MQIVPPPRFCHGSRFQGSHSLHYICNAGNCNAMPTLTVMAISILIYHSFQLQYTKTCHFKWKIHFFLGRGLGLLHSFPLVGRVPPPSSYPSSPPSLWDPSLCHLEYFKKIYATASTMIQNLSFLFIYLTLSQMSVTFTVICNTALPGWLQIF